MYSVSKSFVALAIGFLLQDNMISLNDTMEMYFFNELKEQSDINMHKQTIRDMLTMQTAKPNRYWFDYAPEDRVKFTLKMIGLRLVLGERFSHMIAMEALF